MAESRYKSYTDDELAVLAKTDREARTELLCRYLDSLWYDAGSFAGGRKGYIDADDYHSEGVLGLMSAVRNYDPEKDATFATFAKICSSNRMKNAYRKSKRVFFHETNIDDSAASIPDNDNEVLTRELGDFLNDVIKNDLSERETKVLLGYVGGLSYKEIAAKLGITVKSVDNALTRIRNKMRNKF